MDLSKVLGDMPKFSHQIKNLKSPVTFTFGLLVALLIALWISGGASRADVIGQVVARGATWTILVAFVLVTRPPDIRSVAPVAYFLIAAIGLVVVQLIPLPPSIWTALPGRDILMQAALVTDEEQPWRPISISPAASVNALSSLAIPGVVLLLIASISLVEQRRIVAVVLALVVASALLGLLQFAGMQFDHPLVNNIAWTVSASFANRNHFALFLAIGCLLAPIWAFRDQEEASWKVPVAGTFLILFDLVILATGSRTGIVIGALANVLGLLIVRSEITTVLRRLPTFVAFAIPIVAGLLLLAAIFVSEMSGRAVSIERLVALDFGQDLRRQTLPIVLAMIGHYFPVGSGIGTFDPVYRIHEPDSLLSTFYFNHAHDDILELILDAGLAGALLLVAAIVWCSWKGLLAWRGDGRKQALPRLGSAILLLTFLASITDYPARTPMIMAVVVIGAVWLNGGGRGNAQSKTPLGFDR